MCTEFSRVTADRAAKLNTFYTVLLVKFSYAVLIGPCMGHPS